MSQPLPLGSDLHGMRAVVMGLGQFGGGVAAAGYLAEHGAEVCVTDLRSAETLAQSVAALRNWPVRFVLGEHALSDFERADLIVANPAVPPGNKLLQAARKAGARITSEMELFLHGTQAKLLLVSGTHGKSSTVTFLQQLLRGPVRPVFLGGNLGRPLLHVPEAWHAEATCVVEISSYQLQALEASPLPKKACATGLTALAPDHLERHGDMHAYLLAKAILFELNEPNSPAFLPSAAWDMQPFADTRKRLRPDLHWSAYGKGDPSHGSSFSWSGEDFHLKENVLRSPRPWHLPGDFQKDNALLALGLARAAGADTQVLSQRLPHLTGLPHRLQKLPLEGDRVVYDNGVSTTPETTLAALHSLPAPVVLLVGGQAKTGLAYDNLAQACAQRGDQVHLFGAAREPLTPLFEAQGLTPVCHPDLAQAVPAAWEDCQEGQILLFSPACASFDAYANFQARATEFLGRIEALVHQAESRSSQQLIQPTQPPIE